MDEGRVDLYWLPLGAGGHCVRTNGRMYEAVAARLAGRDRRALYHSALEVHVSGDRYVIEMGPVWNTPDPRGVWWVRVPSACGASAGPGSSATR